MGIIATIINIVLHPIVLSIPAVFLITLQTTDNISTSYYWTFLSFIFSGIISLFVFFGVAKGFFANLDVSNRKQRIILYPFSGVVVLLFALFVFTQDGPVSLVYSSIFFVIALIFLDVINRKVKASIHVAAVSSFVIGVIYVYQGASIFLLMLIPLIAWARIIQKRHTLIETIVGAISGICLTVISIYIVQLVI